MDMDILITGASSYVGARLYFDLSKSFKTVGTYNTRQLSEEFAKLDITNESEVFDTIKAYRPNVIIHAAANASSKSCNEDPVKAIAINEKGTQNVVNAADHFGSLVIYISSTVAELQESFYEKTKFAGEKVAMKAKTGFVILRPSVIYGMSPNTTTDKPFNQILKSIEGRNTSSYDTSWRFQPSWIGHMSEMVAAIIERNIRNEEIPVLVPEMKSKFDIAGDMLAEFGIKPKPSNEKSWRPSKEYSLENLIRLELPRYSYEEIRNLMVKEIRQKDRYLV